MKKINVLANYMGQGWSAIIGLIFVPIYIKYLGIEVYGLLAFFLLIQGIINSLADLGISLTINRELAKYGSEQENRNMVRDLVRTLELLYAFLGVIIGLFLLFYMAKIGAYWLNTNSFNINIFQKAVPLMTMVIIVNWPISLYQNGLLGLQKQVLLNSANTILVTLKHFGVLLLFWLVNPSIKIYLIWQAIIGILIVFILRFLLWNNIRKTEHSPHFKFQLLKKIGRFTVGLSATSFVTFFVGQIDKLILSRLLSVDMFGYYSVASTVKVGLSSLASPIFTALFPEFCQLISNNKMFELKNLYHKACHLVSVIILPVALIIALYSYQVIWIWTGDPHLAQIVAPIASLLVIGAGLNNLAGIPYDLQVASGWSSFGFYQNLIALIFFLPFTIFMTIYHGAIGAGIAWITLNIGYISIAVPIMHRRLLKGELWKWYTVDVGFPLLVAFILSIISKSIVPQFDSRLYEGAMITIVLLFIMGFTSLTSSFIRQYIFVNCKKIVLGVKHW